MSEVSVIIPAYNAGAYLQQTVNSVLTQGVDGVEVIVIDDGSTDDTATLARALPPAVRYVRQTNQGVSAARNHGLSLATGRSVIFLDADDLSAPGALRAFVDAQHARGGDCIFYGQVKVIDQHGTFIRDAARPILTGPPPAASRFLFESGGLPPGAFMAPRHVVTEVGAFDPAVRNAEEFHLWLRCGARTEFVNIEQTVLLYRWHTSNKSSDHYRMARAQVDVRLSFQEWCAQRGYMVLPRRLSETDLIESYAQNYFHRRMWKNVDAMLRVASERGVDSPLVRKLRRYRRLPAWVFRVRDTLS